MAGGGKVLAGGLLLAVGIVSIVNMNGEIASAEQTQSDFRECMQNPMITCSTTSGGSVGDAYAHNEQILKELRSKRQTGIVMTVAGSALALFGIVQYSRGQQLAQAPAHSITSPPIVVTPTGDVVASACPVCGSALSGTHAFCGQCGAAVNRVCECGARAAFSDRFCRTCGAKVKHGP